MREKVFEELEKFEERRTIGINKSLKQKERKNKNYKSVFYFFIP